MHIPDGFLDLKTVAVTNLISLMSIGIALKKIKDHISIENIPLMGIITAFLFTIQLIPFPVIGGTSAHLLGVVLACSIIGPFSTIIVMTVTLFMQALLFQHGGIFTFGANFINITLTGVMIYLILKTFISSEVWLVSIASFIGILSGAFLCAGELYLSGKVSLRSGLTGMLFAHLPVALIECFACVVLIKTLKKIKPHILEHDKI